MVTTDFAGDRVKNLQLEQIILTDSYCNVELFDGEDYKSFPLNVGQQLEFSLPLIALTFATNDGRKFELGCADDFWRYQAPEQLGSSPAILTIEVGENEIVIKRQIIMFPDDETVNVPFRQWRFSWYFAWQVAANDVAIEAQELDINSIEFPENANRVSDSGKATNCCCLLSPPARKTLRKVVRSCNNSLTISNLKAGFCYNPAHLERPKKGALKHWDLTECLEFKLWAVRQQASKSCSFALKFAENSQQQLLIVKAICANASANIQIEE